MTDDQAMDFIQMIPECGCWIWLGSVKTGGYGYVMRDGKRISMHRLSWARFRGPIPDGLFVLHKCDVTSCINPDHLFLGDHFDNMRDCAAKERGRKPRGEAHWSVKITVDQVNEIRRRYAAGEPIQSICAAYKLCRDSIWKIATGIKWKHIPGAVPPITKSEAARRSHHGR